ncbi:MAG: trimethylamine methyltransferase family protein, partial [Chloroflexota bacterium]
MSSFKFLDQNEIEAIHHASLRILAETGVNINDPSGRKILLEAGAQIKNELVVFPADLVEKCIKQCPPTVSVRGRGGTVRTLGDGNLYFHNLGGARDIYDHASGTKRLALLQDVRDAAKVLDGLNNCHSITPFFTPNDVPGELMSLAMYRHTLPHTTKVVHGPGV